MLAILEDAIRCFQEYFRTTRARPGCFRARRSVDPHPRLELAILVQQRV